MKHYAIAGLLLASLATPVLAATAMTDAGDTSPNYSFTAKDHWAVEDTVGNCAVIESHPSAGLKILGDKSGYSSLPAAEKEIKSGACKGVASRA